MNLLSSHYIHKDIEKKWYAYWHRHGFFDSAPKAGKKKYTVIMPPPNITGRLHMGHVLNNAIQDVLVRRMRMKGREVCWIPGTDHASIATEARVWAEMGKEKINKKEVGREAFLARAYEWKSLYTDIIIEQLKHLGISCDWNRSYFTLDEPHFSSVIKVFVTLYEKGYIYKGERMVYWDPKACTALSEEEVNYEDKKGACYYINYETEGNLPPICVATTRPETILGDTALCVHPQDSRYQDYIGKRVYVPLLRRLIPVIADEYVDRAYGTGCLKVTPCHDMNDYALGKKHGLEAIDIFDEKACLAPSAGLFVGLERFVARKKVIEALASSGALVKQEEIQHAVGFSERTHTVVEPRVSKQWFCKPQALSKEALRVVEENEVRFYPSHMKNTYRHWMKNIGDWCISRQLWWGHRIPAWYIIDEDGKKDETTFLVAENEQKAREEWKKKGISPKSVVQEEDVLDTWFSSWLCPITAFNGIHEPDNEQLRYFYPTDDLITAPDIIFFWVARMIMAGMHYTKQPPFKNVYFTGIVRDRHRRKMSKSLGNSPEPLTLIEKHGVDAVRMGMLLCSRAGGDVLFDESLCVQGKQFSNKVWNAMRLIMKWKAEPPQPPSEENRLVLAWYRSYWQKTLQEIEQHYAHFRLNEVALLLYKTIRDVFCNKYLELIKPAQKGVSGEVMEATLSLFEALLKTLHPFMPFLTEEIWHLLSKRGEKECIIVSVYPRLEQTDINEALLEEMEEMFAISREANHHLRDEPKERGITLYIEGREGREQDFYKKYGFVFSKLTGKTVVFTPPTASMQTSKAFMAGGVACRAYFHSKASQKEPSTFSKDEAAQKWEHLHAFLEKVRKKLQNKQFLSHAPKEVIAREQKKEADIESKLEILKNTRAKVKKTP